MIARRVKAHGRVQGVFFRDSTRRAAESRGVSGWVRNCRDGTVEAWFEGEDDAVQSMVEYTRNGPGRAEIDSVDIDEVQPEGLSGFDVR